jgi:SAM-dependent methyltransferase
MKEKLDIRHIAIIDALPVYNVPTTVADIGCGEGLIAFSLSQLGYKVTAIDYQKSLNYRWKDNDNLTFVQKDILKKWEFKEPYDVIICSEVLEHLPNYKKALENLLSTANQRVIITVPWGLSYNVPGPPPIGHCNFWKDNEVIENGLKFKSIQEFQQLCRPYASSIVKIRTKARDVQMNQWDYLIVVDKNQCYE